MILSNDTERPCPAWCTDHLPAPEPGTGGFHQQISPRSFAGAHGKIIRVGIEQYIDSEGRTEEPTLYVDGTSSCGIHPVEELAVEDARRLAIMLLVATEEAAR